MHLRATDIIISQKFPEKIIFLAEHDVLQAWVKVSECRPIAVYGAGRFAGWLLNLLEAKGLTLPDIIVNDELAGNNLGGLSVNAVNSAEARGIRQFIIGSDIYQKNMHAQIRQKFGNKVIVTDLGTNLTTPIPKRRNNPLKMKHLICMLTDKCNLRCRMCDTGQANRSLPQDTTQYFRQNVLGSNDKKMLSTDEWIKIIQEVSAKYPGVSVGFSGGEPFLRKDIFKLITSTLGLGLRLRIVTNGTFLQHQSSQLLNILNEQNFEIQVSIDGPRELHDEIRGVPGSFDLTVEGLKSIWKEQKTRHLISIATVINDLNYKHLYDWVNLASSIFTPSPAIKIQFPWFRTAQLAKKHNCVFSSYPVGATNVSGMNYQGINAKIVAEQLKKIKKDFNQIVSIYPNLNDALIARYFTNPTDPCTENKTCSAPFRKMTITPYGEAVINAICMSGKLGDVRSKGVSTVWNAPPYRKFREFVLKYHIPACQRCCDIFS